MKTCFILLLLISFVTSFDNRFQRRSSIFRQLQDLLDDDEQELDLTNRNNQYEYDEKSDEIDSNRRIFDDEEQYMELRATIKSNETNSGFEITLQNRAAMNTRLRVLYTDANGIPGLAETGRLWGGQTKSVILPDDAKNINIIIEKDIFFENWRVAYKGTLTNGNQCIRIVGVTLFSKIHPCK
ncbi:unnamed protein product [Rotaria sordida]|uniref:Uncharacterized protein n=1 Tax=Rotaria sordida TaxID=392033 RepID=A0A815WPB6_9BILA|nr:unnamed protein product [Rotaria sordida]